MKLLNLFVIAAALCLTAIGCKSTPTKLTYLPGQGSSSSENSNADKITSDDALLTENAPALPDPTEHCDWVYESNVLGAFTVHFDYDSSVVKSEEAPKLQKVAEYLKANPSNAICIRGHCDEQGTEEYNRSLGDRRALALREALAKLDVSPSRLDTISFGKDRPIDLGKTALANRLNRRGEFVVMIPPK